MRKLRRADGILLAAILLAAALAWLLLGRGGAGTRVSVVQNGQEKVYPLWNNEHIVLRGENGEENVLAIENGQVRMESANCRNQICVHTGSISNIGEMIVCMPNGIAVTITEE